MDIFPGSSSSSSRLRVFSISQIPGAYGDAGQNYKNIFQAIKALGVPPTLATHVFGCDGGQGPEPEHNHQCKDAQGRADEPWYHKRHKNEHKIVCFDA